MFTFPIATDYEKDYYNKRKLLMQAVEEQKRLEDTLESKQLRYIQREKEYRHAIEELQLDIRNQSINPFRIEGKGGEEEQDLPLKYYPSQKSQEIVKDCKLLYFILVYCQLL